MVAINCPDDDRFDTWDLASLIEDVISLLYQPRLSLAFEREGNMQCISKSMQSESIVLSMHLVEDHIMALQRAWQTILVFPCLRNSKNVSGGDSGIVCHR